MKGNWNRFLLFFLIFLIVFQIFGKKEKTPVGEDDLTLVAKSSFPLGREVTVQIRNRRTENFPLVFPCPQNPFKVERYENGEWMPRTAAIDLAYCPSDPFLIEAGKTKPFGFGKWNHELFRDPGRYRISVITKKEGKEKVYSREFEVKPPGIFRLGWDNLIYRPILNTLLYLISVLPGHDLGWGIILLTLLIKLILLGPNQKALKSQRAMQRLQPELDALKLKHANDQQRLAQETMALWKKHKVSPLGSCLPLLLQFPILIALFYVIRDGLNLVDPQVIYEGLQNFDVSSVNVRFLGLLDLTKKNLILMPIVVGGLQFLQMHLAFAKTKVPEKSDPSNPMSMMNKSMKYMMPVMIAVFTAGLPSAVGFYWGTSTLFGIAQQLVVNRAKD